MKKNCFLFGCLIILVVEIALVVSLRGQGWNATTIYTRWIASLLVSLIPLALAAIVLAKQGRRFNLKSLFVMVTLVALFLFASISPILEASRARSGARRLLAAGANLESAFEKRRVYAQTKKFYDSLEYTPLSPTTASLMDRREPPPWLKPVAMRIVEVPPDNSIVQVTLNTDKQVYELCLLPERLPNLEIISIAAGVSEHALEALSAVMPRFERVTELHLGGWLGSPEWLETLHTIRALWLFHDSAANPPPLSPEHWQAIAGLPSLQLLFMRGYPTTDRDIRILGKSNSLRYVFFQQSAVTEAGKEHLRSLLPQTTVH